MRLSAINTTPQLLIYMMMMTIECQSPDSGWICDFVTFLWSHQCRWSDSFLFFISTFSYHFRQTHCFHILVIIGNSLECHEEKVTYVSQVTIQCTLDFEWRTWWSIGEEQKKSGKWICFAFVIRCTNEYSDKMPLIPFQFNPSSPFQLFIYWNFSLTFSTPFPV